MDRQDFLPNITAEDRKLIKLFQEEVNRINLLYLKAIHSDDITKANQLMKQMKSISDYLSKTYGKWADVRIPQEYMKGSSYIDDILKLDTAVIEALTEEEVRTYIDELGPIHVEAVNALLDNSKNYVKSSLDGMERQALTMLNQLQQEKIREELARGIISGDGNTNERVIDYFTDNGINGFKDRAGRFWSMDRYVDMLVRTETNIANTQGTINRALELGITKFGIVEHPDCCKECAEMNGDIVDIREGTVELPPFHPNCRGYVVAVLDEEEWKKSLLGSRELNQRAKTPEERVEKALNVIENSTMYLNYEQGAIVGLNGEVLRMGSGVHGEVSISRGDINQPYIFTHNHPNSGPFSGAFTNDGDLTVWAQWKNEYGFRASSKLGTYSLYAEKQFDRAWFKVEYEKLYPGAREKALEDFYSVAKELNTGSLGDYVIMNDGRYRFQKDSPLEFDRFVDEHYFKYYREAMGEAASKVPGVKFEYTSSNGIENQTELNKMYLKKVEEAKKSKKLIDKDNIDVNYYL